MSQEPLAEVRAALARVRRRWMAARLLRAFARLLGGVALGLLFVLLVDLFLAPPDIPMLLLAAAALVATAVVAARVLWPLRGQPTDQRVARLVEERCPELEDRVASATELGRVGTTSQFQHLLVADAAEKLKGVDPRRVVTPAFLRRAALRGGLAAGTVVTILALGTGPLGRVAQTAWLYAFPFNVTLDVEPGDVTVMAGQPLSVRVRLSGTRGAPARTPPTLTVVEGPTPRVVEMRSTKDGYVTEFPSVTESFVYQVSAAMLRSRDYQVDALVSPGVDRIDVEYAYPPFTGLAPHVEEDGGDIYAPAGTSVRLLVHADKAIAEGAVVLSDGRRVRLEGAGAGPRTATFPIETDGSYTIALTDRDGLSNAGADEYFIRATFDRGPEVEVLRPGGDREITPLEEVTIEARATDDYRVDALELVYTVVGQREQSLVFETPGRAAAVTGSQTLYAEDLDVAPGDFITYYARARDVGHTGQARETRSDIFFLEVRPFENEFEEAQSPAGMGRDGDGVGDLAAVQKEIIVATWRLDQASRPAAVADDIRAVAEAQRELRQTAVRAAGQAQRRDFSVGDAGRAPENQAPERLAMTRAVEAMAAAQASLEALSTETSIPHEMEALNQLLRAQAAIRRRQVTMQQGQGGQTSGTQAQEDLSALFDRELRREQETNYETGTSPADQDAQADDESEVLQRLRELSERQAEVNRELAEREEAESDDELRRALERLTREQHELREQLEELADQLARAQQTAGQSSGQQGQTSGASGRADVERIADQMRRAMSELRRQDTQGARARGDQALEALERLEQRLRGGSEGERSGALAEVQLEMQQLADAQRRVADEARQVDANNRSRESRLRLADEKDELADRVDTLANVLEDLDGDLGTANPADAPIRAVREALEREAVGERMRAGADSVRRSAAEAADTPQTGTELSVDNSDNVDGLADEESMLADVLASAAEQLRGAGGQDDAAVRLAAQVEAARELRQRLARLQEALDQQRQRPAQPPADGPGELDRLRRAFTERLDESPGLRGALRRENPELSRDLDEWARHWQSVSAPGTQASKQDFAQWDSLRRNLENALQQFEVARSRELGVGEIRDRPSAGPDEPLPERYRRLVDDYYRSLALVPESR
jgi:hypothetical protein